MSVLSNFIMLMYLKLIKAIVGQTGFFSLGKATSLGEGKTLNSNLLNSA